MLQDFVQSIDAEDLPAEEYRLVKAQQAIYDLCRAFEEDTAIKSELETAKDPENFLEIAGEYGYEFTSEDLQFALRWALEKTDLNSDESDDYELSEEELEAVAGGTIRRRAASNNSYWHSTGIVVENECFYLLQQSIQGRGAVVEALKNMEKWEWLNNNSVKLTDLDGQYGSYVISQITYDRSILGEALNTTSMQIIA